MAIQKLTMKLIVAMNVGALGSVVMVTQFAVHNASLRVQVLGWICVSISVAVFAAPLSIMVSNLHKYLCVFLYSIRFFVFMLINLAKTMYDS